MLGSKKLLAVAVSAAFSAQVLAQSSPEQAFGQNADAIRGYNQIQAGLDRSQRAPLEAVWLRAEVLEDMWHKNPALSQVFQGCDKANAKQGCMVSGRTFWRFTLAPTLNAFAPGLSAQAYRASPPDAEALPPAGGVYLVASTGAIGQKGGSVLLAAGATAQLVDTAYPSILIELKAPDDQPLLLGSLAASDIGKALALLTRQPGSARVASVGDGGRVSLQKTVVASTADTPTLPAQPKPAKPDFSGDFSTLVAALEMPTALMKREAPRVQEMDFNAVAALDVAPRPDFSGDFTLLVAAIELPVVLVKRDATRIQEMDSKAVAALDVAPKPDFKGDFTALVAALEMPVALAKREAPRVQEMDSIAIAALDVAPKAIEPEARPIVIAAIAAKPISVVVDVAPASSANADVARMRAEIEAEVARERERMAQSLQNRGNKRFSFGT
jgi:hypothetical protein